MKRLSMALALASAGLGATVVCAPAAAQGMPVFDSTNYAQNIIQAARALEQVNNQLSSLQNEAAMLQNMAKNLKRIDFPELQKIRSAMQRIDGLMGEAKAIGFKVDGLDAEVGRLFPGAERLLAGDKRAAEARSELDAAMSAFRQAMSIQAGVAENVGEDRELLDELVARSQGAEGALQAQQAASQLLALGVKQQLQLQDLMAAEFRSASIERSRRAQAEADGRAATRRFLGSGKAYTPLRN